MVVRSRVWLLSLVMLVFLSATADRTWTQAPLPPIANIQQSGIVVLRPDGMFCAVANGQTINIVDLRSYPNAPFPTLISFQAVRPVTDIDWLDGSIVAVGERTSITYIKQQGSPSNPTWQRVYSDQNLSGTGDNLSIAIQDGTSAIIGGKATSSTSKPPLFKWNYPAKQLAYNFNATAFSDASRIVDLDINASATHLIACESAGSRSHVVVFQINATGHCSQLLVSQQYDNVEAVAYSMDSLWVLTGGDPGTPAIPGCNTRIPSGGCSLGQPLPITSMTNGGHAGKGAATVQYSAGQLGCLVANSYTAFVNLVTGVEPFFGMGSGSTSVSSSNFLKTFLTGSGDIYSFDLPVLSVSNLVGGQTATITVDLAAPNGRVLVAYSLTGPGPTTLSRGGCGQFDVGLSKPIQVLANVQATASGTASASVNIPPKATGRNVWIQALDLNSCKLTNRLAETVG